MTDTYKIEFNKNKNKYVCEINGMAIMTGATASAVAKKLYKWLASQGK